MGKLADLMHKASGSYSYITITSDESIMVEGCRNILECSDVLVILRTVKFTVEIFGFDMKVRSFNNDSVEVTGKIRTVEIEPGKSGDRS